MEGLPSTGLPHLVSQQSEAKESHLKKVRATLNLSTCADSSKDDIIIKNIMCHVSCVMCHMSCVMCHVSCVRYQVSGVRCQVSGVRCQVSGVRCLVYGVRYGVRCQVSGVPCPLSLKRRGDSSAQLN